MLEFYPVHLVPLPDVQSPPSFLPHARWWRTFSALMLLFVVAACATTGPSLPPARAGTPATSTAEPPPPNVNLSGFPLPYRQGYADGCASAAGGERKDTTRFAADGNYRTGWQDGLALCRKK